MRPGLVGKTEEGEPVASHPQSAQGWRARGHSHGCVCCSFRAWRWEASSRRSSERDQLERRLWLPAWLRARDAGGRGGQGSSVYLPRTLACWLHVPASHPCGDEHVTVLQGAWSFGVGDAFDRSRLRSLPVGSFVVIPAGTPHFVTTESETIIQVHGIGPIGFRRLGDPGGGARR